MAEVKTARCAFKAIDDADEGSGVFEAFAAVFGNVDYHGDRIKKGAFKDTLADWKTKGDPIPVIHSHQWSNPDAYMGQVLKAAEKTVDGKSGLWYRAQADVDHPPTARIYDLMKRRLITQQSFAYQVNEAQFVEEENDGPWPDVRELIKIDLFEVGPTLLGANDQTELLEAASRDGAARNQRLLVIDLGSTTGRDRLRKALADHTPAGKTDPPGDTPASIDTERLVGLLTKTRHTGG